jgi:hypothetical protein
MRSLVALADAANETRDRVLLLLLAVAAACCIEIDMNVKDVCWQQQQQPPPS